MVVLNVMCHGESSAREARAKILVYIYIYIYIYIWTYFPGPGLEISIPPWGFTAQKVTVLGVQFGNHFLGASQGSRAAFWSPFGWFWDLFFWSQTEGLCCL